jgi:DNA-binding transcriptional ArsR family regulator
MRRVNIHSIMQADDMLSQIEEHFHVVPLGEKSLDFGKILSTETSVKVLESVYNGDSSVGISATEISEALGVGRTTVIYHLGRMQESGLVTINPVLQSENSWTRFWDLYRRRNADVSKEQFNQIHAARMNGVKLYVPTKKGFLVLPSTDVKESKTMVKEVLTTITSLAIEGDYRKMRKATSILGTLGVLFIALSFAFQMPFFQYALGGANAPIPLTGDSGVVMEQASVAPDDPVSFSLTTGLPPPAESPPREKSQIAASTDADSVFNGDSVEEDRVTEPELFETEEIESETAQESERPARPEPTVPTRTASTDESFTPSRVLFYLGILLVGSFLGFLSFKFVRRK